MKKLYAYQHVAKLRIFVLKFPGMGKSDLKWDRVNPAIICFDPRLVRGVVAVCRDLGGGLTPTSCLGGRNHPPLMGLLMQGRLFSPKRFMIKNLYIFQATKFSGGICHGR
jgi:hypothetical protein